MNFMSRTAIAISAVLLIGISCHLVASQKTPTHLQEVMRKPGAYTYTLDTFTRQTAKAIPLMQVMKIQLLGPDFDRWENNPLEIKNQRTIRRVLVALKHAQQLSHTGSGYRDIGMADRADTLLVYTKSLKPGRNLLRFDFNAENPASCYGPEFYNVIKVIVAEDKTKRL